MTTKNKGTISRIEVLERLRMQFRDAMFDIFPEAQSFSCNNDSIEFSLKDKSKFIVTVDVKYDDTYQRNKPLAECPYCSGKPRIKNRNTAHWAECKSCGTRGPTLQYEGPASNAWNKMVSGVDHV